MPGSYLIGSLPASVSLTANTDYSVLGMVIVPSGMTLTIPAGDTLRFYGADNRLLVDGTLSVQGSAGARVRMTSSNADPSKGNWKGIEVRSTATNVSIDYADIEWAYRALSVSGTQATVKNSLIRNFSDAGIFMSGSSSLSQISSNYIDNYTRDGVGIYLENSSPAISANKIYRAAYGIYLKGSSNPLISGNLITENTTGIYLFGGGSNIAASVPNPVINGNDIYGNTSSQIEINSYGPSNPVSVNATGNWWGTPTPASGSQIKFTGSSPTTSLNFSSPATSIKRELALSSVAVSQQFFSPNGDGVKDATTISAALNKSASWTVSIFSSSNQVVKTFTGSGSALSAFWDGKNTGNVLQPDNRYRVEVSAVGSSGTVLLGVSSVVLDQTAPSTIMATPLAGTTLGNVISVVVTGTAADSNLVSSILDWGAGASPTSWTTLNSTTTSINQGNLGTWTVSSTNGSLSLTPGSYVLRLRTSDKAGNSVQVLTPVTLDGIGIRSVSQNVNLIRPLAGESLQVSFSLNKPATVQLRIYREGGTSLVRQVETTFTSSGTKTMTWNGRDTAGSYVEDDAYSYTLYAFSGASNATYDAGPGGAEGAGSGTIPTVFNSRKNNNWKIDYTLNANARVRLQVTCGSAPTFYPYNWVAMPAGLNALMWDGRDASGQLVTGSCGVYFDPPRLLAPASVLVKGVLPIVSGVGAAPNIEVKSNPYMIVHSYNQISNIVYRVDQDSYVTAKLLPPSVTDFASASAIVLTNNVLKYAKNAGQPVDQTIEWRGYSGSNTNAIFVSDEGAYTFAIQATSVASGKKTLYRGVLGIAQ